MADLNIEYLVIGAGVSGLAFANFVSSESVLIVEADSEIGGYCKTVKVDGFVWDYSGHFFHFKHPELERYLLDRMPADEVKVVRKDSRIVFGDRVIDFPFQKNIHQLAPEDFVDCLYTLYFKDEQAPAASQNFHDMLYQKFGRGIADRFLVPYNEKLYACDLRTLDVEAMGRFFPHANLDEIIRNFKASNNDSYNATFTYPRGGAIQYVNALKADVPDSSIALSERIVAVDLESRVATTTARTIGFDHLVSSAPFPQLLQMCDVPTIEPALSWNKVLVFNLGFDRKGWRGYHWVYFPEKKYIFYRVGFYDNIFDTDRMSLYVEIGFAAHDRVDVAAVRKQVLSDLALAGIVEGHELVAEHSVVLDPAYVHISSANQGKVAAVRESLAGRGVHSIGRYGAWTYCSIEDNMIEARDLALRLSPTIGG